MPAPNRTPGTRPAGAVARLGTGGRSGSSGGLRMWVRLCCIGGALCHSGEGAAARLSRGRSTPLYALQGRCAEPRLPALAGPWAVGCGAEGAVDRALPLAGGQLVPLPVALPQPCLGPGTLWDPSVADGLIRLGAGGATRLASPRRGPQAGPCALDGEATLSQSVDGLELSTLGSGSRTPISAAPVGWEPVGLAANWAAWVERLGGAARLHLRGPRGAAAPFRPPPGARHVISAGGALAWVEPGAVARWRPGEPEPTRWPAETGFSSGLGFDGLILCWEERGAGDVDIACTDGLRIDGPGHQQAPSRWGPWLLYREGERPTLWSETGGTR